MVSSYIDRDGFCTGQHEQELAPIAMNDKSLINFGELSKPATVLIEKISEAVGGLFKPFQIVRVAKAEAEAERIREKSNIEVTDLDRRAMYRFLKEEAKKQLNIEDITWKALPLLKEKSSPQNVEDDWITNFFDKCRIVSDEDMQQLWSRVLAGEANTPGGFSKQTVNLLADLDRVDAELFMLLCGFGWIIEDFAPLVFDIHNEIYNRHKINFTTLGHLEHLGFIQLESLDNFTRINLPKKVTVLYYERPVELTLPENSDNDLNLGHVLMTRAGLELARVCGAKPVDGFFDFVYEMWAGQSLVPKRGTK